MEIKCDEKLSSNNNLYNLLPGTKICGKFLI